MEKKMKNTYSSINQTISFEHHNNIVYYTKEIIKRY